MSRAVVVLAFAICIAVSAEAQRAPEGPVDCTPVSMSADYGGPLAGDGISLVSLADDHPVSDAVLDRAIDKWAGKAAVRSISCLRCEHAGRTKANFRWWQPSWLQSGLSGKPVSSSVGDPTAPGDGTNRRSSPIARIPARS